jgi:hypothetical protein
MLTNSMPEAPAILQSILQEKTQALASLENHIAEWDSQVPKEKQDIATQLQHAYEQDSLTYKMTVEDLQWPSIEVCQDLGAPDQLAIAGPSGHKEPKAAAQEESILVQQLMELISRQENEFAQRWDDLMKKQQVIINQQLAERDRAQSVQQVPTGQWENLTLGQHETSRRLAEKRRRRRLRIRIFKSESATEAQDWLEHFEHACDFGKFTEQEKLEELDIVLEGMVLKWLTGLP